eukprot:13239053-Alexandrium_andersonii.AAC.1
MAPRTASLSPASSLANGSISGVMWRPTPRWRESRGGQRGSCLNPSTAARRLTRIVPAKLGRHN